MVQEVVDYVIVALQIRERNVTHCFVLHDFLDTKNLRNGVFTHKDNLFFILIPVLILFSVFVSVIIRLGSSGKLTHEVGDLPEDIRVELVLELSGVSL